MQLSLIVAVIGALVYLLCDALGKYQAVGWLGFGAYVVGLLAFLLK